MKDLCLQEDDIVVWDNRFGVTGNCYSQDINKKTTEEPCGT